MEKIETIKRAIDSSEMTREECATLFRISRNTLCRWLKGLPIRNFVSLDYAYFQAQRMIKATADGKLPLPKGLTASAKEDAILHALK